MSATAVNPRLPGTLFAMTEEVVTPQVTHNVL
jgi:hypothetical protein